MNFHAHLENLIGRIIEGFNGRPNNALINLVAVADAKKSPAKLMCALHAVEFESHKLNADAKHALHHAETACNKAIIEAQNKHAAAVASKLAFTLGERAHLAQ